MSTIVEPASDNRIEARREQARGRRDYDHGGQNDAAIQAAAARITFRLNYSGLPESRRLLDDGIAGPPLEDAYGGDGQAPGDWSNGDDLRWIDGLTEDDALAFWFNSAVNEAVHEALEWFRIDGAPALDPHSSEHETAIYEAVNVLAAKLWSLRSGRVS